MAAQTFKRARAIAAIARVRSKVREYQNQMAEYAELAANANKQGRDGWQYLQDMAETYRSGYLASRSILADLMHDFEIREEELPE